MRILVLTSFLPWPLASGGQVRQHQLLDAARSRHQLTLVVDDAGAGTCEERQQLRELWPDVRILPDPYTDVARPAPPGRPLPGWRLGVREMRHRLDPGRSMLRLPPHPRTVAEVAEAWRSGHDLVQVEFTQTYRYLPPSPRPPVLLVAHDVLARRDERAATLGDIDEVELGDRRAARHERQALRDADVVVVTGEPDREAALRFGARDVRLVPNGADDRLAEMPPDGDARRLLYVGWGGHGPNRDALGWWRDEVYPHLEPGTVLEVAGAGWDGFDAGPGIRFLGLVPDIRSVLSGAVVVVPLRVGGGTKLKVVEAMAASRPVVATPVAAEGLPVRDGVEMLMAPGAVEFAAAVRRLMGDEALRLRLGTAARAAAQPLLWSRVRARMLAVYEEMERA